MNNDIMETIFGAEGAEVEPEKFKVTNLQSASWCMAKISTAVNKIANAEATRDEAIRRINVWYEEHTEDFNDTISTMEEYLAPWVDKEINTEQTADGGFKFINPRKKSVKLPNGVAGYRSTPESVIITDEVKIIEEAKAVGIETHVKESVHKKDLKAYMYTGKKLDNAYIIPGGEKFYVKIKGEINEVSDGSK